MAENVTPSTADVATSDVRPTSRKSKDDVPWTVGQWHDYEQLQCKECPWDTLDGEQAMRDHIQAAHYIAPPPSPLILPVRRDRFGNEVK